MSGALVLVWASCPTLGFGGQQVFEVRFDARISVETVVSDLERLRLGPAVDANAPGKPDLPWLTAFLPQVDGSGTAAYDLNVLQADTLKLNASLPCAQPDILSSDTSHPGPVVLPDPQVYGADAWYPQDAVASSLSGSISGQGVTGVAWCPFQYNPLRRELVVIRHAILEASRAGETSPPMEPPDTVSALDDIKTLLLPSLQASGPDWHLRAPGVAGGPSWMWGNNPPLGVSYVVITSERFVEQMRPLVLWKARRGIAAGLATIEQINAHYFAVDGAASIREYLKAAYGSGLKWVVLAGDESVVPVRYAYAGYDAPPTDLHQYQVCDLYFGELDGDWDANGNGVWGEYFGDKPELYPELYVGRLLFSDTPTAETIVRKIIQYEAGPADGSYLTRELSVCADQMRDWGSGVGQQKLVADAMPSGWSHDDVSMMEEPSGIDPSPLTPDGRSFVTRLATGFGWVNYYVHGRADGIVVRSPGYLNSPLSYVFTFGSDGDGNGHFNTLPAAGFPGIHLSAACDQGGFDLDSPPFDPVMRTCVAERLLSTPDGGAVAFVGQSRWGWVSSSYKLISKFYEYLGDASVPNHVGVYQALAKVAFPSYRDLNYGNNLYGDPEMPAWKETPKQLAVTAPSTHGSSGTPWVIEVHDANGPVAGALATVAIGDTVWTIGETDGNGGVNVELALPAAADAILTVSKPGYRVQVDTVPYGIITDVGDNGNGTPKNFQMLTNTPNPFNPSTIVRFSLPKAGRGRLRVFDILGRPVATLVDADLSAGPHAVEFDGVDQSGRALSSGVYFAQLTTGGRTRARKMVLLR